MPATDAASQLEPDAIAGHDFGTSFRGYDTAEVRAFLERVAAAHRALILQVEAGDRQAAEKLAAAEERAATLIREAKDEARRVLSEVDGERERGFAEGAARAAEVVAESEADRVRIEQEARIEANRLIGEAKAARQRVLGDLNRRRKAARAQVEQLHAARDRLLASLAELRGSIDTVTEGLRDALPAAKAAADAAARRVEAEDDPSIEQLEAEIEALRLAGLSMTGDADAGARPAPAGAEPEPAAEPGEGHEPGPGTEPAAAAAEQSAWKPGADRRSSVKIVRPWRSKDPVTGLPEEEMQPIEAPDPEEAVRLVTDADLAEAGGEDETPAGPDTDAEPDAAADTDELPVAGAEPMPEPAAEAEALPEQQAAAKADSVAEAGPGAEPESEPAADAEPVPEPVAEAEPEPATEPAPGPEAATEPAPGPGPASETEPAPMTEAPVEAEGRPSPAAVDALFARLKAKRGAPAAAAATTSSPEPGAAEVPAEPETLAEAVSETAAEPDAEVPVHRGGGADRETLLARRDSAIGPATAALGRRLKRLLNDEQNELLDALRRLGTDAALPDPADHAGRWAQSSAADLALAAAAGSAAFPATDAALPEATPAELAEVADAFAESIARPLHDRLAHVLDEADGDADEAADAVRATYRTWRAERVGPAVTHAVLDAFAVGVERACPAGTPVCWIADDGGVPCPDAEDNALAGVLVAGTPFPTGHQRPPAHPGCRCLVVPAPDTEA